MREWSDPPVKKVYQTTVRMMMIIVGAAFVAGMLVGWNFVI